MSFKDIFSAAVASIITQLTQLSYIIFNWISNYEVRAGDEYTGVIEF